MSSDGTASNGVTNNYGEVLTGNGKEAHRGLVVTDGALFPTALGVNPLATITALAERSVQYTARKIGLRIDYKTKNGKSAPNRLNGRTHLGSVLLTSNIAIT
jgi:choline dehydrogenase-like flavoprotein